ncbi:hypothetical protein BH23BAC2_BH23BAC2_18150 [soil metagenome]
MKYYFFNNNSDFNFLIKSIAEGPLDKQAKMETG